MKIYRIADNKDYDFVDTRWDEPPKGHHHPYYVDIGHMPAGRGKYENMKDVIMWAITEKGVETIDTNDVADDFIHEQWFTDESQRQRMWSGRYDKIEGTLTINTPIVGFGPRKVPKSILRMLTSKFPDVKKVYAF